MPTPAEIKKAQALIFGTKKTTQELIFGTKKTTQELIFGGTGLR